MNDESEVADWKNHPTLESTFVATLVEWHKNGAWASTKRAGQTSTISAYT